MRVAFNARLLNVPTLRGFNRYLVNLVDALADLGVEAFLFTDSPIHPDHLTRLTRPNVTVRDSGKLLYPRWINSWVPRQCKADRIDIFHSPMNFGLPLRCPCKKVLTLHDAIDKVYYGGRVNLSSWLTPGRIYNTIDFWTSRKFADAILTVSNHAKQDIIKYYGLPADKIHVTHAAADDRFYQPVDQTTREHVRAKYSLPARYLFYVGGWEKRKNIPFLLRAFAEANLQNVTLVLGGGRDDEKPVMRELARSLDIERKLHLLGWIDDEDLPALYAEAMCFVYPSEYEGFGLQLVEAMATGCPVLVANATSLPEVMGNGGRSFDLSGPHSLAGLLSETVPLESARSVLSQLARERASDFSWKRTAEESLRVFTEIVRQS